VEKGVILISQTCCGYIAFLAIFVLSPASKKSCFQIFGNLSFLPSFKYLPFVLPFKRVRFGSKSMQTFVLFVF
jgi:hypothetical protein